MDDTAEDRAEPFVTLKNGPMDGTVIPLTSVIRDGHQRHLMRSLGVDNHRNRARPISA